LEEEKSALKGKVATLETAATAKETELESLTAQTAKLTRDYLDLETICSGLRDQVFGYELFKEQCKAIQDEQVKVLSDRVVGLDSKLMALALYLDEEFYPCFLTTIAGPSVEALEVSWLQTSYEQPLLHVHQNEENVVTGDTSLSNSLDVVHVYVQKLKESSTSRVPVTDAATTALAISGTAANISSILPVSVANYDMLDAGVHDTAPHSPTIVFEKKDL
nr:hypothetical protein [Tanacetum cinerariifolium]